MPTPLPTEPNIKGRRPGPKGSLSGRPIPWVIAVVLGLIMALWTWTLPGDPALLESQEGQTLVSIRVLNNGFHTDLAIPRAQIEARPGPLAIASRSLGQGDWVLIGWGDATFFVDESPMQGRLLDGVRAFFRPGNASVVKLDPETGDPSKRFRADNRRTLVLTLASMDALLDRVETSLETGDDGDPRLTAVRPGDGARFFASHETFWIGYLCNNWTARVLNAGGLAVRPMRAETAGEIMATLDRAKLDSRVTED